MRRSFMLMLLSFIFASNAYGYFSIMDTGEVLPQGRYKATLEPQFVVTEYDGVNLIGNFDMGLTEDSGLRALVGFGTIDFHTGILYKWMPFPDLESQPAIGLRTGLVFAHVEDENELSLRLEPLVSKLFETNIGAITPYASLPLGMTSTDDDNIFPIQVVAGAEWKPVQYQDLRALAEVGFNINKAFSYVSFGVAYYFGAEGSAFGRSSPRTTPGTSSGVTSEEMDGAVRID